MKERTTSSSSHSAISSPITRSNSTFTSNNNKNNNTEIDGFNIMTGNNLLQSPKKVIKALYDYTPQGPGELQFSKGDFFHVMGNENDTEWYEACNPSTNVRGMVPVPYFEVFGKTQNSNTSTPVKNRNSNNTKSSQSLKKLSIGSSTPRSVSKTTTRSSSSNSNSSTLYGVVLYEFKAERPDELDIHVGESIILCAHHNYEWFIAKPIDRLGGPGLVPVSYVSVINIVNGEHSTNDIFDDINNSSLPTVEEWKNKNARYKANSIPLGSVEESSSSNLRSNSNSSNHNSLNYLSKNNSQRKSSSNSQLHHSHHSLNDISIDPTRPTVTDVNLDTFHIENGRYWFHINVNLSNGESRSLGRYYEDFYDFQIQLLENFPNEAGKNNSNQRILPFIPGPLTYVTDKITMKRTVDLNEYVKELINLPDYISHSNFVLNLFELKHEFDYVLESSSTILPKTRSQRSQRSHKKQHSKSLSQQLSTLGLDDEQNKTIVKDDSTKTLNAHTLDEETEQQPQPQQQKLKFYYEDDIFALLIPANITIEELKFKITKRIYDDEDEIKPFKLFIKDGDEITNSKDIDNVLKNKLKISIED